MYDNLFASSTIGSKAWVARSRREVDFLEGVLALKKGDAILDVPCGTGRHSFEFAKKGYRVVGVDISRACLAIARKRTSHKNVKYVNGDMSKLERYRGRFDLVTNLFSSFGYFATDKQNEAVLRGMVRALKPGGRVVINTINRTYLMNVYKPAFWMKDGKLVFVQASRYDAETKYNESYITIVDEKTGVGTARYHRMRLYSPNEMIALLKKCGCDRVITWGDFDGSPLDKTKSYRPVYVGIKRA